MIDHRAVGVMGPSCNDLAWRFLGLQVPWHMVADLVFFKRSSDMQN